MRAFILICGFVLVVESAHSQEVDTLATRVLSEVVVSGVKIEADTLQSFYRSNPSATTESILSRMSGVSLLRRGAFGQEAVLRGLSSGQINVTLDGMKIFGACTDKMDPATIYVEPANLKAISLSSGLNGAEYGSTFGGSLDLKLNEPTVGLSGVRGAMSLNGQSSASALNYSSSLHLGKANSALLVNGTYRKSNEYRSGGGTLVPYSQYEKVNAALSGKQALSENTFFSADFIFDKGWNIGFPALPMDVASADAFISSLTFQRVAPWLAFNNIKAKVYHNLINHSMDDTHRKDVAIHMDMPGRSETWGAFVESDVAFLHCAPTRVKVDYFENAAVAEMIMYPEEGRAMYMQTTPRSVRRDLGVYVSQSWKVNQSNKFTFNLRGDIVRDFIHSGIGRDQWNVLGYTNSENTRFNKTISISYNTILTPSILLEVNAGYGERPSTINERFGFYLFSRFDGYDYIGNPDLDNENSWNGEVTLTFFRSNFELQVSPYLKSVSRFLIGEVRDDMKPMTIGARGVKQYIGLDNVLMNGVDAMAVVKLTGNVQWICNVKYTQGRDATGDPLPLMPPLKVVNSVRYELTKGYLQGEVEAAGAQNKVSERFGESTTNAYAIAGVSCGYKLDKYLNLAAGVDNLFDKNFREHLDWGGIPRPGRNIYLTLNYKFGNGNAAK